MRRRFLVTISVPVRTTLLVLTHLTIQVFRVIVQQAQDTLESIAKLIYTAVRVLAKITVHAQTWQTTPDIIVAVLRVIPATIAKTLFLVQQIHAKIMELVQILPISAITLVTV